MEGVLEMVSRKHHYVVLKLGTSTTICPTVFVIGFIDCNNYYTISDTHALLGRDI